MTMMTILTTIYSLPYFLGALTVAVLWPLYRRSKVRWQNRYRPLPDGGVYHASHISRVWLAGLIAVAGLGYVLLTATRTHDDTVRLTKDVGRCWQENYQSARAQIVINGQNEHITEEQQALQRDYDRATSDWLKDLVNPPGDLAGQPTNAPERQAWGLQRTAKYQEKLNYLGAKSDDLVNQRAQLDAERARNKLPEATCGK